MNHTETKHNKQGLYLLLTANAISGFSQGISMIAIPWYIIKTLGKGSFFGFSFAIITFLTLPWSLYSGTLVDRYNRKKIFLFLTLGGLIASGSVALVGYITGSVPVPLLIILFGITIFIFNVHYPTLYAFGQEITTPDMYSRTSSLIEVQGQFTSMISGAMASLLLSGTATGDLWKIFIPFDFKPWSLHEIFLLDASTYVLAFLIISRIIYTPQNGRKEQNKSIVNRFKSGVRFLKKNPLLIHFGIASFTIFVVVIVTGFYLMSLYVSMHLHKDADIYGLSEMMYAFGALLAGFTTSMLFRRINTIFSIILLSVLTSAGLVICAFSNITFIFIVFNFFLGVANAATRILRITYLFKHIPNHIIGRSNSLFAFANILLRGCLILAFALPYFSIGNHVTIAYLICGVLVCISIFPLVIFYSRLKTLKVEE